MSDCSCTKQDQYANCCMRKLAEDQRDASRRTVDQLLEACRNDREEGFKDGMREAVREVQGWRELTIKEHKECPVVDPAEGLRETNNKLSLLGVIESRLRSKAGEGSKAIFDDMKARKATEGVGW